jgi:hypothetical protein
MVEARLLDTRLVVSFETGVLDLCWTLLFDWPHLLAGQILNLDPFTQHPARTLFFKRDFHQKGVCLFIVRRDLENFLAFARSLI